MTELEKLFRKAERNGISKWSIGRYVYGKGFGHIYTRTNPTSATIEKIKNAIKDLTRLKKKATLKGKENEQC